MTAIDWGDEDITKILQEIVDREGWVAGECISGPVVFDARQHFPENTPVRFVFKNGRAYLEFPPMVI